MFGSIIVNVSLLFVCDCLLVCVMTSGQMVKGTKFNMHSLIQLSFQAFRNKALTGLGISSIYARSSSGSRVKNFF